MGETHERKRHLRYTWLRLWIVLASMDRALIVFLPFAALVLTWWWKSSFLSRWIPSHLTVLLGVRVLVIPS